MTLERARGLRARCLYREALAALAGAADAASLVERSRLHEDLGDYEAAWSDAERAGSAARLAGVARARGRPLEAVRLSEITHADEARAQR
ncbi:MAG: hypothetical protein WD249_07095, partial [Gaiellaceae bacterium]